MFYRVVRLRDGRYIVQRSIGGRVWISENEYRDEGPALAQMNRLADGRGHRSSYPRWRRRRGEVSSLFRMAMMTPASISSSAKRK